jgi:hypothetical protein
VLLRAGADISTQAEVSAVTTLRANSARPETANWLSLSPLFLLPSLCFA